MCVCEKCVKILTCLAVRVNSELRFMHGVKKFMRVTVVSKLSASKIIRDTVKAYSGRKMIRRNVRAYSVCVCVCSHIIRMCVTHA